MAYHLEAKMKAFKDSIPLLLDLKHEALRDRCVLSSVGHRESREGLPVSDLSLLSLIWWPRARLSCTAGLEMRKSCVRHIVLCALSVRLSPMRTLLLKQKATLSGAKCHLQLLRPKVFLKNGKGSRSESSGGSM